MKKIISVLPLIILAFSGCCSKTQTFAFGCQDKCIADTYVIKQTKYIKQQLGGIPDKPIPEKYDTLILKIDGKIYYATDKVNSAIMSGNWISYKAYSDTLRAILINLKNEMKDK